jgi:arginine deiminase
MKLVVRIMFIALVGVLLACEKTEKPLYDQVMDIHDEVMPKMNDLYKIKKQLQDSISNTPDMPGEQKQEFMQTILELDAASTSMMEWMRAFNPPDQKEEEAFQKYMESELVKVKKMREDVMKALEKGNAQN